MLAPTRVKQGYSGRTQYMHLVVNGLWGDSLGREVTDITPYMLSLYRWPHEIAVNADGADGLHQPGKALQRHTHCCTDAQCNTISQTNIHPALGKVVTRNIQTEYGQHWCDSTGPARLWMVRPARSATRKQQTSQSALRLTLGAHAEEQQAAKARCW
jgi:hypothetical protein